jgi:ribosomal protein S18 acetylase RimI-like enzyme
VTRDDSLRATAATSCVYSSVAIALLDFQFAECRRIRRRVRGTSRPRRPAAWHPSVRFLSASRRHSNNFTAQSSGRMGRETPAAVTPIDTTSKRDRQSVVNDPCMWMRGEALSYAYQAEAMRVTVKWICAPVALRNGETAILRPAATSDAEGLIEIQRQVVLENVANVDDHIDTAEECRNRVNSLPPSDLWLVAERDGKVLGSIRLLAPGASFIKHIRNLYIDVHCEWRGVGLGAALIEAAGSWAREHGVEMIALSVLDSNPRARGLYERLGFKVTGHIRDLVKRPNGKYTDDVQMALQLDALH